MPVVGDRGARQREGEHDKVGGGGEHHARRGGHERVRLRGERVRVAGAACGVAPSV